jgi:hypothetical protein
MRSTTWARWATFALAISICVPAALADHKKSLADCTSFDQNNKDEDTVEFTVKNSCTVPLDCSLSWRVVCAPDSKKRRNAHASSSKFSLTTGMEETKKASASVCGDDTWVIDSVEWGCAPNKD